MPAHADIAVDASSPRHLHVSFVEASSGIARRSSSNLRMSLAHGSALDRATTVPQPCSPFVPPDVLSPRHGSDENRRETHESFFQRRNPDGVSSKDLADGAVLIYQKQIDDLRRFRVLFVGLLVFIISSIQGMHALFGLLLMQQVYRYSVEEMVSVYICGAAFGMFVLPFGALYDWFGPRIVVAVGTTLCAIGQLLFALMFAGHLEHSVRNSCLFYGLMSWGCYALDVAVLPTVVNHMPRDRGQPIGLMKTFSGLGASLISCLFRGFFNGNFSNLMWFTFSLTVLVGGLGVWYLKDAPYIVTRWDRRNWMPRQQLRTYLIRNRYMSQLMPRRRYYVVGVILVVLNFYLTIQAVCVAYMADQMTPGKYRGVAIGAVLITVSLTVLLIPSRAIDGPSPHERAVVDAAREKEEELRALQRERQTQEQGPAPPTAGLSEGGEAHGSEALLSPPRASHHAAAGSPRVLMEVVLSEASLEEAVERPRRETREASGPANRRGGSMDHGTPAGSPGEPYLEVSTCQPSTYDCPHVETITICGEVFVKPVYETTFLESLTYLDLWMIAWTTACIWGIGLTFTANWSIYIMVLARNAKMDYKFYVLFAALSGVATAGGRVFLSVYELIINRLRERHGILVVSTVGYPIVSIGFFLSLILMIALPGSTVLVLAYMCVAAFYGLSTSITFYVLGTIFDKDLGTHYGFCFLGAAVGMVLFFQLSWYESYQKEAMLIPMLGGKYCVGQRRCMNTALIIYLCLSFTAIGSSYVVHWRYKKLVLGTLQKRRVILPIIQRALGISHTAPSESVAPTLSEEPLPREPLAGA